MSFHRKFLRCFVSHGYEFHRWRVPRTIARLFAEYRSLRARVCVCVSSGKHRRHLKCKGRLTRAKAAVAVVRAMPGLPSHPEPITPRLALIPQVIRWGGGGNFIDCSLRAARIAIFCSFGSTIAHWPSATARWLGLPILICSFQFTVLCYDWSKLVFIVSRAPIDSSGLS